MADAPAHGSRRISGVLGCLLLLAVACGDKGDETAQPPTTVSSVALTSTVPPATQPTSTTLGGTGTTRTIPPTTLPPQAETQIDQSLVPEKTNMDVNFGKTTVNGVAYTNALIMDPFNSSSQSRLEINAGRTRTRFLGELGVPDTQRSSTSYKVDISFDLAAPVLSIEVRFGETKKIDLDITGVLRIKISVTPTSASSSCCDTLAIGDARLRT